MFAGHGLMWSNNYSPDKPRIRRKVDWRRILALFRPYWWEQSVVFGCIVISALLGLIPGFMTARIIDVAIPQKNFRELTIDVGVILGTALLSMGFGVAQGWMNSLVGEGIMRDIRTRLVSHLHRMPLSFFTGTKTGEIMNRVSSDVDNVDNVVTGTFDHDRDQRRYDRSRPSLRCSCWNWRLALISLVVVPFMILPLGPVGRRMYDIRKKTREQRDEIESITQETLSISGITLIKSFAREAVSSGARFYDVGRG